MVALNVDDRIGDGHKKLHPCQDSTVWGILGQGGCANRKECVARNERLKYVLAILNVGTGGLIRSEEPPLKQSSHFKTPILPDEG